ncbi:MAG: hypothetical protein AB8B91_17495 [Rubripirellula sp.]
MNIVILHCHFERGGVTQVVENHVRWLQDDQQINQIVLVSGHRVAGLSERTCQAVTQIVVDDFDYDPLIQAGSSETRSESIVATLQAKLSGLGIDASNAVLHWHNHSLGKNTAAPRAIHRLASNGWRLLLQIHDFAEDYRPMNLQRLVEASAASTKQDLDRYLYPTATQIRYATLTGADATALIRLGVPETAVHCLPNSVVPLESGIDRADALSKVCEAMDLPADASWCLYPVRGIRRKNVGEFLLLCRWLPAGMFGGITLRPTTEVESLSYQRWRSVAVEVSPNAVFDAAHHPEVSFAENLAAAEFAISTSVAEGFGMAFLEPWLMKREVIARRLPTVTDDFESSGVKLPKLYDQISIPGDSSWVNQCAQEEQDAFNEAWSDVAPEFRPRMDRDFEEQAESVDFARLTPVRQIGVLRRFQQDRGFERDAQAVSASLVKNLSTAENEEIVSENSERISAEYSPEQTGRKLIRIYAALANSTCDQELSSVEHAGAAVDLIASARPFYPCRTEKLNV